PTGHRAPIEHEFHATRAASHGLAGARRVQVHRITHPAPTFRGGELTLGNGSGRFGCERYLRRYGDRPWFLEVHVAVSRRSPCHREGNGVGVAVGNVCAARGDAVAPPGEIDAVHRAEMHVNPPLPDAATAHA